MNNLMIVIFFKIKHFEIYNFFKFKNIINLEYFNILLINYFLLIKDKNMTIIFYTYKYVYINKVYIL